VNAPNGRPVGFKRNQTALFWPTMKSVIIILQLFIDFKASVTFWYFYRNSEQFFMNVPAPA